MLVIDGATVTVLHAEHPHHVTSRHLHATFTATGSYVIMQSDVTDTDGDVTYVHTDTAMLIQPQLKRIENENKRKTTRFL